MDGMLTLLGEVASIPYGAVNIAITLIALTKTFGVRWERFIGCEWLLVVAWSSGYFVVYELCGALSSSGISYLATLGLNLAFTIGYALLFVAGDLAERLALAVSCLFSIMGARSLVTSLFKLFSGTVLLLGSAETLVFYLVLYAAQALMALLFVNFPLRSSQALPPNTRLLLVLIPLSIAAVSQAQIAIETETYATIDSGSTTFQLLALVAMLGSYCLTSLVTRAYDDLLQERSLNQRLELSLDHVQRSGAIVEQVRQDKHELKNLFLYMQALYNDGRYDELGAFLNEQMPQHFDELTEFHTGNNTLDYLLTQKASEARQAGARTCFEVVVPEKLEVPDRDLCGLLGNLLDNAIDASRAETAAGHEAEVRLSMQTMRGFLFIQTRNRCSDDVLAKNPDLRTTKGNAAEHGIGLKVIKKLVRQHSGSFATAMEDGYFVATALLAL